MKKLLVTLCTVIFMITALYIPVYAASSTLTASVDNNVVKAGDTIEINVSLKNNPGLNSLRFEMPIDPAVFEFVGADYSNSIFKADNLSSFDKSTNTFKLNRANDDLFANVDIDGSICSIKLKIKNNAKNGDYDIEAKIDPDNTIDMDFNIINVDSCAVKISVNTPCPHTNKTSVAEVPATCASTGTKAHEKCSVCGKLFLNGKEATEAEISTPKNPDNHDGGTEIRNAEPATEEKEGYTGDTYCLGCNQIIEKGETIPIPDHVHSMTHTAPTAPQCTTDGVLEHWTCTKCGKIYADEAGTVELESTVDPKPGHKTEIKNAKEANCTEAGYTGDEICTVCNETIAKGKELPPKGHIIKKVGTEEANCSEAGYTGDDVCTVCNETINKGEVIPPTGEHEEVVRDAKEADCSNEGYTGDTYCKNCGEVIERGQTIPKNDNHDFEWKVDVEPTFDETGLKHEECTRCGIKRSENTVIDKITCFHEHMEHHEKVAAACSAPGNSEYWHCPDCGKSYSDEAGTLEIEDIVLPIDPENHVQTELRGAKSSTCTEKGYTGDTYCKACEKLIEAGSDIPIDPEAHSYVNNTCEYCQKTQYVYNPPTYIYVDDGGHISGGRYVNHTSDYMGRRSDGVYEWYRCRYCMQDYGKKLIEDSAIVIVDDPVQSDNSETVDGVETESAEISAAAAEETNPKTGIALALIPMALALLAAAVTKIKK